MSWIGDWLADWFREILVDGILSNFEGMFDLVNSRVADIATQVGQTPQSFNASIFSMIQTLSETIILPIAGMILTYVLVYELIQMITEKNNLQDFDTFNLYKWIFKTFIAIFIMTNIFNIVMAIFDIAQHVVNASAGFITGTLELGDPAMMYALEAQLETAGVGELIGILMLSFIARWVIWAIAIIVFVIVIGRMIEIYLTISLAPIPFATMSNREWSSMGFNYLKALFAVGFQGFLIMICVAIYGVLVAGIVNASDINIALVTLLGYTVLLCFMLFKTGGLSKSIFGAH